jgi:hypothetical protein
VVLLLGVDEEPAAAAARWVAPLPLILRPCFALSVLLLLRGTLLLQMPIVCAPQLFHAGGRLLG